MKQKLFNYSFFLLISVISFSSCISKRKYLSLQNSAERSNLECEEKTRKIQAYNDSLILVMSEKDSIIDSLSVKLIAYQLKKETLKPVYNRASTLSKEQEYNKKALFIYNFTKNIEWPVLYNGTQFVIGVSGAPLVLKELQALMIDKKVGGKEMIIEEYKPGNRYNVVYVASSKTDNFIAIKALVKNNKTLLVTDDPSLNNQGAHISFSIDKDKVHYIVNKTAIEKAGMKVTVELMRFSG
jgi:hypothetical protein